jgi:hypothetical protein
MTLAVQLGLVTFSVARTADPGCGGQQSDPLRARSLVVGWVETRMIITFGHSSRWARCLKQVRVGVALYPK